MGKEGGIGVLQGYEPFGSLLPGRNYNSGSYRNLFQGQEHDDELYGSVGTSYAFEYRMHDPRVGRFWSIDPLAADYPWNSPYAFSENRVIDAYELEGLEAVLVIDSDQRPQDNGTNGTSYSAEMYYLDESNGEVSGPYRASTYPNSISNTNNATTSRTANEGAHAYNNASGHKGGTRKGLNLVDANGNRNTPGTEPDGRAATMSYVNVHAGASNRGNYNSRGSEGCITICPDDAEAFFGNFNWTNTTQTKGNSEGTLTIVRADAIERATTLRTFQINAATLQSLTTAIGTRLTPRDIPEETRPAPEIPETR